MLDSILDWIFQFIDKLNKQAEEKARQQIEIEERIKADAEKTRQKHKGLNEPDINKLLNKWLSNGDSDK